MNELLKQKQAIDALYKSAIRDFSSPEHARDLPIDFNDFLNASPYGKQILQHLKMVASLLESEEKRCPRLFVFENYAAYQQHKAIMAAHAPLPFYFSLNESGLSKEEPMVITFFEKVVIVDSLFEAIGRMEDIVRKRL